MSEPRHAMIYRDAMHKKWWLEIVAYDVESDYDTLQDNADSFGPFDSEKEAEEFGENRFQNTGFAIPVLDPEVFAYLSPPDYADSPQSYIEKETTQ